MFSPRWRKVGRDLWLHLPRTLLVILAITIGIVGVGSVLNMYAILMREIEANWALTNPASAVLYMTNVDDAILRTARNFPGVADAQARRTILGRVQVGPNAWEVIRLFVVPDFNNLRINTLWPEAGQSSPDDRLIVIERASLPLIKAKIGDALVIRVPGNTARELPLVGLVWDPGQPPAWVDGLAFGYITPNTLAWLGETSTFDELRVIVSGEPIDQMHIRDVAQGLIKTLQEEGHVVSRIDFPEHLHTDLMNSFLFLLEAFGILCLVLSGVLTATLISALLSQQVRQIGAMKAVGASTRQVMGIYFGAVIILSLIAVIIALPLAAVVGQLLAVTALTLLNFKMTSNAIPLWVYLVQITLGNLIPLLTTAYPVYRGSRITVREALNDYGVSQPKFGASRFDTLFGQIRNLPRPLILALRNSFRRRARITLTLMMLAAGGASFIAAIGAAESRNRSIDDAFANIYYDIEILFDQTYAREAVMKSIRATPGMTDVEAWGFAWAFPRYADGNYRNRVQMFAAPPHTTLIDPPILQGRWLRPDDTNAVVLSLSLAEPEHQSPVRVGDDIVLKINDQDITWQVVGIVGGLGAGPAVYASYDGFAEKTHTRGLAASARVAVEGHDPSLQKTVSQSLEQHLAADGFSVSLLQRVAFARQVLDNHVLILLVFLISTSVLVVAVGALGLASTMSVNVMERAREIGMMRAVGASTRTILQIVVLEGILIAVLSWFIASVVSVPLTTLIVTTAGSIWLRASAVVIPSWAIMAWLIIVIVVAAIASLYPAWSATRITVREVLAYE